MNACALVRQNVFFFTTNHTSQSNSSLGKPETVVLRYLYSQEFDTAIPWGAGPRPFGLSQRESWIIENGFFCMIPLLSPASQFGEGFDGGDLTMLVEDRFPFPLLYGCFFIMTAAKGRRVAGPAEGTRVGNARGLFQDVEARSSMSASRGAYTPEQRGFLLRKG